MSIDMTCVLFAFHSQQVKQSAYDNLPPLLTTPFSSLVMNVLVLDLRPVWRCEGCWQHRSFRERCIRQHFQVSTVIELTDSSCCPRTQPLEQERWHGKSGRPDLWPCVRNTARTRTPPPPWSRTDPTHSARW